VRVRIIEERDIERLLWIESIVWRNGVQFKEEHLRSQLKIFPEGQLCFEDEQGKIWGFANMMQFRFDLRKPLAGSWGEITNNGYITTHDPGGNWLFGVNLSVHMHGFFLGATEALIVTAARICIYKHLRGILLVGRMPGYARWLRERASTDRDLDGSNVELARLYMESCVEDANGTIKRLDPQIELYESFGMNIIGLVAKFIPDEKSLDFGVSMVWPNILYFFFYLCPSRRVWKKIIFGTAGKHMERAYLGLLTRSQSSVVRTQSVSFDIKR
jgi:hypothetical protein